MPLIGTAGHVDHGKSTLIQRLTGRDPDRWEEEKRRGLTIDLGFAWMTLPGGIEVSFVDVPGHERYLKNMLAGIEAIDVALFVVAADEGWMPQSEEHLAVLDLLGVKRGVVALTKRDIVDSDLLELAEIEAAERLEGTSLAGAEVIPISSTTGQGVADLIAEMERLVADVESQTSDWPRLWVDRSFSATGSGTVVTGSLLDGSFSVDDPVQLYPGSQTARVRGIQSHEKAVSAVDAGRRVALNLSGVDRDQVPRGTLIGKPGQWDTTERMLVRLKTARYVDDLNRKGSFQLHIGSSVHSVEITALEETHAVVKLPEKIPARVGDRFIVRDTGRKLVVAGGRILDPSPHASRAALRSAPTIDPDTSADEIADALLRVRNRDTLASLMAHSGGGSPTTGIEIDGQAFSDNEVQRLSSLATELVMQEHTDHPLRVGLGLAALAERLDVDRVVAERIVDDGDSLERIGPDVTQVGRDIEMDERLMDQWDAVRSTIATDIAVPTVSELGLDPELLHLKVRQGELIRLSDELVMLPGQIEQLTKTLRSLPEDFTVAIFRDAAGVSRKYAVPFLEWTDKEGLTVRRGDTRRLR